MNDTAAVQWADAMRAHIEAPPDDGYGARLRGLARAARARAEAARVADAAGLKWVRHPGAIRSQPPSPLISRRPRGHIVPQFRWWIAGPAMVGNPNLRTPDGVCSGGPRSSNSAAQRTSL